VAEPAEPQRPRLTINEVFADDVCVLMESIVSHWGEDDNVVQGILAGTYNEHVAIKFWSLLALKAPFGEILVDVGAYTGVFSLIAAKCSWINKIIAFEPSAVTFGRMVQNIALNGVESRIIPCNLAAHDAEKVIPMPHQWGHYALCSGESFEAQQTDHSQPAFCVPLDCLLTPSQSVHYLNSKTNSPWPFSRVAAIKIDVEGAEISVLKGARQLIARDKPVIIAEALGAAAETALAEFASSVGYAITRIGTEWNFAMYAHGDDHAKALLERATGRPAVLRGVSHIHHDL
jgi:FkbM family methyltransferase